MKGLFVDWVNNIRLKAQGTRLTVVDFNLNKTGVGHPRSYVRDFTSIFMKIMGFSRRQAVDFSLIKYRCKV